MDSASSESLREEPEVRTASFRERAMRGAIGASILLVNGDTITVEDILDPIKSDLERKAATLSPEDYLREVRRAVAMQIWSQVNERLVYREAAKQLDERMGQVLDAEADRYLRARVNAEFGGRQSRFEKYLAGLGRTLDQVREQAKRRLLVTDYLRSKFSALLPQATRPELWQHYRDHLDDFTQPGQAELFLIDIPFDAFQQDRQSRPGSADWLQSKEQARTQARAALAELEGGLPFEAVAETYSKGIHARDGGAWGAVGATGLVGRYQPATEALAELDSDSHSGVVEGSDGFFIVGTGRVERAQVLSFEQAQPRIRDALSRDRYAKLEREYLDGLREQANVQRWQEFQLEVIRVLPRPQAPRPNADTANER